MKKGPHIRACYLHACLKYVNRDRMTNATLRKRLGIKESSYTLASRIISDTIDSGLIRLHSGTRRDACYVSFWA
jgi:ATP-dependent DNA helicase RecG